MDSSDWLAETLRFTVFTASPVQPREQNWFESIIGESPEQETNVPKLGQFQQNGPFEGGSLRLVINPNQLDWIWSADVNQDTDYPSVGDFDQASKTFAELMKKWLPDCPSSVRVAHGIILLKPVPNLEVGYEKMSELLNEVSLGDLTGASDLVFQINRPRPSKTSIEGLKINRLTSWSVMRLTKVQLQMGLASSYSVMDDNYSLRLVVDVNTSADYGQKLPNDRLLELYDEFRALSTEIAEKGDCK